MNSFLTFLVLLADDCLHSLSRVKAHGIAYALTADIRLPRHASKDRAHRHGAFWNRGVSEHSGTLYSVQTLLDMIRVETA